jgi:hypothetical protein
MGLDISAYSNIRLSPSDDTHEIWFSDLGFEQSNDEKIAVGEDREYDYDECFDFRAGSYRGYNIFRSNLCNTVNGITDSELWSMDKEKAKKLPFYYLINFSDCEGFIGTKYCKKLYKDFCEFETVYQEKQGDQYYLMTYSNFKEAFRIGSNNGVVSFH